MRTIPYDQNGTVQDNWFNIRFDHPKGAPEEYRNYHITFDKERMEGDIYLGTVPIEGPYKGVVLPPEQGNEMLIFRLWPKDGPLQEYHMRFSPSTIETDFPAPTA